MRLIVPFPPGGGTDNVGRILATRLGEIWGQQIVIENRGGGGSNVGSEAGAKAPPDGYTMLFAAFPFATNQFLYSKLPYDPVADFTPISLIGTFPNILVVPNTSSVKTVTESDRLRQGKPRQHHVRLVRHRHLAASQRRVVHADGRHRDDAYPLSRRRPGDHRPHPRPADHDVQHLGLADAACQGGPVARAGGEFGQAIFGRARAFRPSPNPACRDSTWSSWYGLVVPAKTPGAIVDKMNADSVKVMREPDDPSAARSIGPRSGGSTSQEFSAFIKAEMAKWDPVIKAANINAQ